MIFGAVQRLTSQKRWLVFAPLLLTLSTEASGAEVYYRYLNDQGVQVLDDSIPPKYAQKGYEIVSVSGDVVKVVPPAPDAEDLARREAIARVREGYQRLSRRYSSVAEIEAAKQRKLENLDANIAIMRGNIAGLEAQIENLMSQAADIERSGRKVPEVLLQKLADVRVELAGAEEALSARLKTYDEIAARYDEDMDIYKQGRELAQAN